jgi:hypothetical protein
MENIKAAEAVKSIAVSERSHIRNLIYTPYLVDEIIES